MLPRKFRSVPQVPAPRNTSLEKSEQWKRAAIVMRWVDERYPDLGLDARNRMVIDALRICMPTVPWEYPWSSAVISLRERSEKKRA